MSNRAFAEPLPRGRLRVLRIVRENDFTYWTEAIPGCHLTVVWEGDSAHLDGLVRCYRDFFPLGDPSYWAATRKDLRNPALRARFLALADDDLPVEPERMAAATAAVKHALAQSHRAAVRSRRGAYRYRSDPVPGTGGSGWSSTFRHPRTLQESRVYAAHEAELAELGLSMKRRGRSTAGLPTAWDDLLRSDYHHRCWKRQRKHQWKSRP